MKKSIPIHIWFSIPLILLSACGIQDSQPLATSSNTSVAAATLIPSQTEVSPTPVPSETPTFASTPPPAKEFLLNYELRSSPRPPFHQNLGKAYPELVLYPDGQLIINEETFQQKTLTAEEIAQFLLHIENLGFYRIESNQKYDPTDTLYDFGSNYDMEEIGSLYCVVITPKARELCAYEPYREFLIPEMRDILNFLDTYKPEGTMLYSPDRLLVKIGNGRNPSIQSLPEKPELWPAQFPSLKAVNNGVLYVDGDMASKVFEFLGYQRTPHLVTQDGLEYTIEYARPVLPHEVVSFP